jgi:hypothetical protein
MLPLKRISCICIKRMNYISLKKNEPHGKFCFNEKVAKQFVQYDSVGTQKMFCDCVFIRDSDKERKRETISGRKRGTK